MKKIEAIIRKAKFEDVKQALYDAGIEWFSYWDITGIGKSKEDQVVRGQVFQSSYIQRRMLSIVCARSEFGGNGKCNYESCTYWRNG